MSTQADAGKRRPDAQAEAGERRADARAEAGERRAVTPMKRVAVYLAFTFGLTWTVWIVSGIVLGAYTTGLSSSPAMIAVVAVGMFFPLVGALLTNAVLGRENRFPLAVNPRIRGNAKSYLLAWFVPACASVLGAALYFAVFPSQFDAGAGMFFSAAAPAVEAGQIPADMVQVLFVAQLVFAVTLAPLINMIPAFGEEAGWRGMLFPNLALRFSPRMAVLIGGAIWGLWHAPITVMGHNYGLGYAGWPVAGILAMIVFCTSLGSCLSYLRVRAESVWPCALAHGAINAISGIGLYFSSVGATLLGPSPAGILAGVPLLLLGAWCWWKMPSAMPPTPATATKA